MNAQEKLSAYVNAGPPDGSLVKSIRCGANLTQVEFAEVLGISNVYLCWVETGKAKLSKKLASRILTFLNKSKLT